MYCTPAKILTARVQHRCTYCGEPINPGETYHRWASYDIKCSTNKMHLECLQDAVDEGDGEYTPFCNDRPQQPEKGELTL